MKTKLLILTACLFIVTYAAVAQVQNSGNSSPHQQPADKHSMMLSGDMEKDMQMMNKMMVKNLGKSDSRYDARFIDMMIPHHEGAVMMAKDALTNAQNQELKDMAAKMIKDQQKEIEQMKKWRQQWYGSSEKAK